MAFLCVPSILWDLTRSLTNFTTDVHMSVDSGPGYLTGYLTTFKAYAPIGLIAYSMFRVYIIDKAFKSWQLR